MINEKYKYSDLTEKIIGCAMKVHSFLGNGFPEVIYQRSLAIELKKSGLNFSREIEQSVYYDDVLVGTRIVDFKVEEKVLIELKAVSELNDQHYAQIINYLKAFKLEIGLLINFGSKSLQFKRFISSNLESKSAKSINQNNQ
ncbi:MAG: GxxExxY protein [Ignavibacteria bacterium]|nr:GxxExxY protein [Ignavibacteria bacterium]MCC7159204.1 GxxExxY protein [Ignavibacteria bacterium]